MKTRIFLKAKRRTCTPASVLVVRKTVAICTRIEASVTPDGVNTQMMAVRLQLTLIYVCVKNLKFSGMGTGHVI